MVKSPDPEEFLPTLQAFLEEIREIDPSLLARDEEDENEPEDEEEEEEYSAGSLSEKVKKYQREFSKYAEIIKRELKDLGYEFKRDRHDVVGLGYSGKEKPQDPESERSPSERGHKFGCGCPGCAAFRQRLLVGDGLDFSLPDGRQAVSRERDANGYRHGHNEKKSDYPCGGKLRGMFKQGFLRYAIADIDKRPGMMNRLAV